LHRRGKRFVVPVVLGAVVFWVTLMPWLARNYFVFGKPIFVRGDLGAELRIGNNPEAGGGWVLTQHPANNSVLHEQYVRMGEAAFVSEQGRLAKEWIAQHPQAFLVLSLRRFFFFWAGLPREGLGVAENVVILASSALSIGGLLLAAKRRMQSVFLFATLLAFYPLIYYFTFPTVRYHHAIDPELVILAVFLISQIPTIYGRNAASGAPISSR
jgi:hypothetical protein